MANSILASLLPTSWIGLAGAVVLLVTAHQAIGLFYNVFLHPLKKFPGPLAAGASVVPTIYHAMKGDWNLWVTSVHATYGDVVRISPKELSFSGADAPKDMYGHRAGNGGPQGMTKDPRFYKAIPGESPAITSANFEDHSRMRRIFSNAFSDRALKLQEPLFLTYVDKLIAKLRTSVAKEPNREWNMVSLLNFTTFDIMGDLTFGEPLDMLDNDGYHPWVATIFKSIKFGALLHSIRYFPRVEHFLLSYCIPKSARAGMESHRNFSVERVDRRLQKNDARPDIWGLVLKRDGDSGLTRREMYSNASVFMVAGTETTATLLSGLTYLLLKNPSSMERLVKEIRTTFPTEADITIEKLQAMKYLHACIEEALRMYPPVPIGLPRVTPPGEPTIIDGKQVPPGMSVMATHFALYRNPENFRNPYQFAPERWLPESTIYASDKKQAFQPFSLGPRGCLGKK